MQILNESKPYSMFSHCLRSDLKPFCVSSFPMPNLKSQMFNRKYPPSRFARAHAYRAHALRSLGLSCGTSSCAVLSSMDKGNSPMVHSAGVVRAKLVQLENRQRRHRKIRPNGTCNPRSAIAQPKAPKKQPPQPIAQGSLGQSLLVSNNCVVKLVVLVHATREVR